jgi:hypothetical protein
MVSRLVLFDEVEAMPEEAEKTKGKTFKLNTLVKLGN